MRGEMRAPNAWRARELLALWILAFSFYAVTGTGHSGSPDGTLMLLTARSLVQRGELSIPPVPGTFGNRKTGTDGREYAKYAPGMVLAHVPMLVVSRLGKTVPLVVLPDGSKPRGIHEDEFWGQFTSSWVAATVLVMLALFATDLGASRREAWMLLLLVGVASPVWFFARVDSFEMLQALGLLGAATFLHRARVGGDVRRAPWIAGAFAGLAVLAKTFDVVLIPLFVALVFGAFPRDRRTAFARFLAPVALAIGITALYNAIRFGSPFDTGYDLSTERFDSPLLPGVAKLLASPSFGLLTFWPPLLLVLAGFRRQGRATPAETALALGTFTVLLLLYAQWWAFSGLAWGPRFLVPAIPLLSILALPVVRSGRPAARAATLACLVAGAGVQTLVATTSHWQQVLWGTYRFAECPEGRHSPCLDDPRIAPLRIAWWRTQATWLRAHDPEAFTAHVARPPWADAHPWRDPDGEVERQRRNTGLDLWAAPEPYRLGVYELWLDGHERPVPKSPLLAGVLLALGAASLVYVLRAIGESPRAP